MWIGDLESDGLLPGATKIHCGCFINIDTQEQQVFTPTNIDKLPSFLSSIDALCMHNGISFDLKLIKKVYNYEYRGEYFDTLLASRVLWPDIAPIPGAKGPHSVAAWGSRFGVEKPVHEDWTQFSPEMLHRCQEDTKIQAELYIHIQKYINDVTANDSRVDFEKVFRLEHRVWEIIEQQSDYGFQFDLQKAFTLCNELESKLKEIDAELIPKLPIRTIKVTDSITKAFTASGEITAIANRWHKDGQHTGSLMGDFCKVKFKQMNLNSDVQLKTYLLENGWQPKEYNVKKDKYNKPIKDRFNRMEKTSPKLPKTAEDWQAVEEQLKLPSISLISERNKASHRLSQIKGLIENTRQDHRIEARANTVGTPTRRFTHSQVVNIPKARDNVYYGKQMRSLFTASPGRVLVGCDAHALEARVEAHYLYPYDKESALELIDGDIHTRNMQIFGCDRDKSKGGKYAIGYGCAAPKLASTIGVPVKRAEEILKAYWEGNPGLKELKDNLETAWEERGYILSIDRAPLSVRYKHALINTLFQSAGSILMKAALCIAYKDIGSMAHSVGNFHDEMIFECKPEHAETVAELLKRSIESAGKMFNLNVPLTGESKIGNNWAETH